uniref:Uncharacterized protein n=1 Tax=Heliothis virescens TaxID=7102 RepID=A0A2A4JXI8_HELVI
MHISIFSLQAVLLAVLVINYHHSNEVEAEEHFAAAGDWMNSMERKGAMNQILTKIKTKTDEVIDIPRRMKKKAKKKINSNEEDPNLSAYVNQQELADLNPVTAPDASDITKENETELETPMNEVTEKHEVPKKKKKSKKHKRKHKPKNKLKPKLEPKREQIEEQLEPQPEPQENQEQKPETTTEKEIQEFSKKNHRKEHRRRLRKKFVKMGPKEESRNATITIDSDEVNNRKPVDIIVHIKMNE